MFKNRTGIEVVMTLLTVTVGAMLVLATVGVFVFKILNPTTPLQFSGGYFDIIKLVLSAIVGYVAGRGLSTSRGNTDNSPDPIQPSASSDKKGLSRGR